MKLNNGVVYRKNSFVHNSILIVSSLLIAFSLYLSVFYIRDYQNNIPIIIEYESTEVEKYLKHIIVSIDDYKEELNFIYESSYTRKNIMDKYYSNNFFGSYKFEVVNDNGIDLYVVDWELKPDNRNIFIKKVFAIKENSEYLLFED